MDAEMWQSVRVGWVGWGGARGRGGEGGGFGYGIQLTTPVAAGVEAAPVTEGVGVAERLGARHANEAVQFEGTMWIAAEETVRSMPAPSVTLSVW